MWHLTLGFHLYNLKATARKDRTVKLKEQNAKCRKVDFNHGPFQIALRVRVESDLSICLASSVMYILLSYMC